MAGRGSRLRPHTLTVPKPLIPIANKPIVHRLVQDIAAVIGEEIEEIAFIIGPDFGEQVAADLKDIAASMGAKGSIYIQDRPLGTGHAIMCAQDSLSGPAVIAYADTLFRADFKLDPEADGMIWVKQVENPSAYGVVSLDDTGAITGLVEKPTDFVSDLAVIGIYYFKDVSRLKTELQKVLDQRLMHGGEYQINDGIKGMQASGARFTPGQVDHWMDCGNKKVTVDTNTRILDFLLQDGDPEVANANNYTSETVTIIEPCVIGDGTQLENCTVGPGVSIGANCTIKNATIKNSLIQNHTTLNDVLLENSMIGNHVHYNGSFTSVSLGDYTTLE